MTFTRSLAILALSICFCTTAAYADEPSCPGGYANRFLFERAGAKTVPGFAWSTCSTDRLPASPVSYFSGSSGFVAKSYIGVPLLDLLNDAVINDRQHGSPERHPQKVRGRARYRLLRSHHCRRRSAVKLRPPASAGRLEAGDGEPLDRCRRHGAPDCGERRARAEIGVQYRC